MLYRQYSPEPGLQSFVRNYWTLRGSAGAPGPSPGAVERVIPDGRSELILHLGDPFAWLPDSESPAVRQAGAVFAGQAEAPVLLQPTGSVLIFGVTFESSAAYRFNRAPQWELANRILPVQDAWTAVRPSALRTWEEAMRNAPSDEKRIALADQFLRTLMKPLDAIGMRVQAACDSLRAGSVLSIDGLAANLNVGRRQLERDFQTRVGISPKTFAQVARVQRALVLHQSNHSWTWSRIAQEAGYYDHAHLIADFRRFTGAAPTLRAGEAVLEQAFVRG